MFHTDDDVFFRSFPEPELRDDEVCFSLRLGVNVRYCYPLDQSEHPEGVSVDGDRLRWSWREQGPGSFSYPLSLNGHIFRTTDVKRWLGDVTFENPNEVEAALQAVDDGLQAMMASYAHSVVVSLPVNIVNDVYFNRSEWSYGAEELNERFFLGQRIHFDRTDFSQVASTHEQIVPVLSGEDVSLAPIFAAWARERASWPERSQALGNGWTSLSVRRNGRWNNAGPGSVRHVCRCKALRPCKRRSPHNAMQSRPCKRRWPPRPLHSGPIAAPPPSVDQPVDKAPGRKRRATPPPTWLQLLKPQLATSAFHESQELGGHEVLVRRTKKL